MPSEVLLLANFHYEPSLSRRLNRALDVLQPSVIAVESGPDALETIQKRRLQLGSILRTLVPDATNSTIDLAELLVTQMDEMVLTPHAFSAQHGVPCHYVDDHPRAEQLRRDTNFRDDYLRKLIRIAGDHGSSQAVQKECDDLYAFMSSMWGKQRLSHLFLSLVPEELLMDGRDRHAAKNILAIMERTSGTLVHNCGLAHTLDDPEEKRTLYSILADRGIPVRRAHLLEYAEGKAAA